MGIRLKRGTAVAVAALAVIAATAVGGRGSAQDGENPVGPGTPPAATPRAAVLPLEDRPARLVAGTCAEPGDAVETLTDLAAPIGDAVGPDGAVVAESAFSSVSIPLDALVSDDYAIVVGASLDEPDLALACGEVGGIFDADGALVIGLQPVAGSGASGIAYLFPSDDGTSSNISTFLAGGYTAGTARGGDAGDAAGGTTDEGDDADEEEEASSQALDVSLREWSIDLPSSVAAGLVIFTVTNDGTEAHSFDLSGNGLSAFLDAPLAPGENGSLAVNLPTGVYTVTCPLDEGAHVERGMIAELTVE